ncbi:MAG: GAF domain-containing protein [Chloroflexi bacterium]|nr:GAF domain-containing protein [Chloroflexota bacterium]MCC6894274.1 GAF domain-containing protein [Anaerolineae bacterium]
MNRTTLAYLTVLFCGLLTGFTLLTNIPTAEMFARYGWQAVLWVILIAVTLMFGVLLREGEFSAVHVYGSAAFLSTAGSAEPLVLWSVALGAALGGVLLLARTHDSSLRRRLTVRTTSSIVMICSRVTLSLLVAGRVYEALGGTRPLVPPLGEQALPLVAFCLLYTVLYALIFLLETYVEQRSIRRLVLDNRNLLAAMLVIPLPFGALSAVVISLTPTSIFAFSIGALLASLGLYRFSRTNYQFQKQLDEQRSLIAVSQALQSDLKLDSLLYAIYNQVVQLMHTDQFVVALYKRGHDQLRFPLVMRNGQAVKDYHEDTATSPLGRVLRQQQPLLIQHDGEGTTNWHSWLGVPLLAGGRLLGAIAVRSDDPLQPLGEDDKRLLSVVATSASVAIDNAQLYEQQTAQAIRMEALNRTLPLLTGTLALDTVQQTIVAAASDMLQADGVALYLRAEDVKLPMQLVASTGLSQANETLLPDEIVKRENKATYWGLDLVVGNERLGGLAFFFNEGNSYDEDEMPIALTFAAQAAQAIHNAQKYTTTDQALEQQVKRVTETRDRLQVILDTMREGIVLIDREGVVALANPRVDLIGLHGTDLLGKPVADLLEKPDVELAERMGFETDQKLLNLAKTLRNMESWSISEPVSYTVTLEAETRHIERNIIPVVGDGSEILGALLVFSDETEARELMQMRADLANMIVHDLRSPLTAVTTGLKLLRDVVPTENTLRPTVVSITETSQRAIRKMLVRVDSLLDISRLDSGFLSLETEPTDMATLADGVCVELSPVAQEMEVTLTTDIGEETPALDADGDKVERVLQNLVDNALKFCPAGGNVTIRAHQPEEHDGERFVRIDVTDSGPGVPDEYKSRLFDRFVQVKGRRGTRRGSGLGLTFCRLVVEAHGGKIWIEDNPGGGSIFAFTLPVAD